MDASPIRLIMDQRRVPEGLRVDESPMILDWSADDLRSKNYAKWPPANALLSDLLVYKIIAAEISSRFDGIVFGQCLD